MAVSGSSHNHGWKSVATGKLIDGFSFHPKLAEWLQTYTNIPKEAELEILEVSCGEVSCPTEETMIVWDKQKFRISRKKENISKMDVDLSWKRFNEKD
ncbi:hypothetical protein LEP1GSC202_0048 [Leptospira yanagawae serovar Saopaulo str. Sao Paulo = ATCC 700523]|uniref:Uncharacterized protein n=2 Tax=Leptospira yanagawae TaxID=293069 RepID=A0ABY2M1D6_9LEPT|nr:hypothetical protein [Leptospira yanagawae]EOQ86960.1 hypothetical protein LEP1GSC202_0048 [Leptospira yanagawae serovar Saopaulo str. Sao Paulo = ATCC 700523]TGL20859.1 hypothetical protein EHQ46_10215 [Leptospira yanagawae]